MLTDIQIAQSTKLRDIKEIAKDYGIDENFLELYGNFKAKVDLEKLENLEKKSKLVLVTAMSPTPAGEGKTTVNIGLSQALNKIGVKAISALREPSLGPSFGMKGGACGGGYSQVLPMEDINLHFTGDMHAITYANNLISAMLDNHLHHGNQLNINPKNILWKRALDLNDRSLRDITIGQGGLVDGVTRRDGFNITVASEIMAILCLSKDIDELKERISNILIAYTYDKKPIYVRDIKAQEAAALLLKDAIKPNLVQTTENTLAVVHGGPFANIAHGCNSINATNLAMKIGEYTVTEAGFGADLGAEKFFDIKCRLQGIEPDSVVLVATIRAMKYNGGVKKDDLDNENIEAMTLGFANVKRHIENLKGYGKPIVIALNRFPSDTQAEIDKATLLAKECLVDLIPIEVFSKGGEGAIELAKKVVEISENNDSMSLIYDDSDSIETKINKVCKKIYRADDVILSNQAQKKIKEIEALGYSHFPVCMAKTQYSFSDDPSLINAPEGFQINVRDLVINSGAGFIVCLTGDLMTMPGLPKVPAAQRMKIYKDGKIEGLS
ncbi:MAG: formate--tetrahydrofolate ligase [Tissierellia bacterium]|nr:formate--tetrahydrofolate ligase [Tissierellia bacterium]